MTEANCRDDSGAWPPLSEADLRAVVGGGKAAQTASTPPSGKAFEVDSYAFDIEQVLR